MAFTLVSSAATESVEQWLLRQPLCARPARVVLVATEADGVAAETIGARRACQRVVRLERSREWFTQHPLNQRDEDSWSASSRARLSPLVLQDAWLGADTEQRECAWAWADADACVNELDAMARCCALLSAEEGGAALHNESLAESSAYMSARWFVISGPAVRRVIGAYIAGLDESTAAVGGDGWSAVLRQAGAREWLDQTRPVFERSPAVEDEEHAKAPPVRLVTGLWDTGRAQLPDGWGRDYGEYLELLRGLLRVIPYAALVFGDSDVGELVRAVNAEDPLAQQHEFVPRDAGWFRSMEVYHDVQRLRCDEEWRSRAAWLGQSPQAQLELYNPIVLSKPFLLHDALLLDGGPLARADYYAWVDAGLLRTVREDLLRDRRTYDTLRRAACDAPAQFLAFPYAAEREVHGFEFEALCEVAGGRRVAAVCRGGLFGVSRAALPLFNRAYHALLVSTLRGTAPQMGTEESLFTALAYRDAYPVHMLGAHGMIATYCEAARAGDAVAVLPPGCGADCGSSAVEAAGRRPREATIVGRAACSHAARIGLYVLTFNAPAQLRRLFDSFRRADPELLSWPDLIVVDNSTDPSTREEYRQICAGVDAEWLPQPHNRGICGGRQYIAEHSAARDYDYHLHFEDDMALHGPEAAADACPLGMRRYVPSLLRRAIGVAAARRLDLLKLSFSEFYGHNCTQFAWYNVPQSVREREWPHKPRLPDFGLDDDAPRTRFNEIDSVGGLAVALGHVYYCNWPQIVSREGNRKMFLDTTWEHPFEQTWMSHVYQLTTDGRVLTGVLLLSPVDHERSCHYASEDRREN